MTKHDKQIKRLEEILIPKRLTRKLEEIDILAGVTEDMTEEQRIEKVLDFLRKDIP